jgi:hypothetical protein
MADRNAVRSMFEMRLDTMTGRWAELRDMRNDEPLARIITDAVAYQPSQTEEILLEAVITLLRENAVFRKRTLHILETTATPFFIPPQPRRAADE